jgi:hypothetical protein
MQQENQESRTEGASGASAEDRMGGRALRQCGGGLVGSGDEAREEILLGQRPKIAATAREEGGYVDNGVLS